MGSSEEVISSCIKHFVSYFTLATCEVPTILLQFDISVALLNRKPLLGHVLESLGKGLLAERKLANGPDLGVLLWGQISIDANNLGLDCRGTYRLEVLLDLGVESTGLQSDDLRGGIGVVGDGRAALGAEETVDNVA